MADRRPKIFLGEQMYPSLLPPPHRASQANPPQPTISRLRLNETYRIKTPFQRVSTSMKTTAPKNSQTLQGGRSALQATSGCPQNQPPPGHRSLFWPKYLSGHDGRFWHGREGNNGRRSRVCACPFFPGPARSRGSGMFTRRRNGNRRKGGKVGLARAGRNTENLCGSCPAAQQMPRKSSM